jgi:tripeptidyl-peptidase-1
MTNFVRWFFAITVSCAALHHHVEVPAEWQEERSAPTELKVAVTFALRQRDISGLAMAFERVVQPSSKQYGQYLSLDQVRSFTDAEAGHRELVADWITSSGIPAQAVDDFGDALRLTAQVHVVEALLRTRLALHKHRYIHGLRRIHFASGYTLPDEIASVVEFVSGLHPARGVFAPALPTGVNGDHTYMIPATLRKLYGVPDTEMGVLGNQSVASFGFGEAFDAAALADWFNVLGMKATPVSIKNGTGRPGVKATAETTTDIQYITTVGSGVSTLFEPFSPLSASGAFYDHAVALVNDPSRSLVVSISWGEAEDDYNTNRIKRTDTEYMKLGAMGVSVLVASGDKGACPVTEAGKLGGGGYPSSSPYVTSVGATMVDESKSPSPDQPHLPDICNTHPCTKVGPEIAANDKTGSMITTGGGFALYNERPSYQDSAVQAYLRSSAQKAPESYWNSANRGYPDVSANGDYYLIRYDYQDKPYAAPSGTSCSTPTVAGIFSLLNSRLLKSGKPPLGFANPLLYTMAAEAPGAFNDITQGNNAAGQTGMSCPAGFWAAKGWDPVTGLGTPNFSKIWEYLLSADSGVVV